MLGPYTHQLGSAEAVAIDASDVGVRVHTPTSPGLMGFLTAVTPGELSHFARAALARGKRALPPLPAVMPQRRAGWLLDATAKGIQLWSQASDKAVRIEPAFFYATVELYARLALEPWEGRLVAPPGASLEGRAPAWVDELRVAHIDLLTVLRQFRLEPMQPSSQPMQRPPPGLYANDLLPVRLTEGGVRPDHPAMKELFEGRLPRELPGLAELALFGGTERLPALDHRVQTTVTVDADQALIVGSEAGTVDRQALLSCLDLDLRWATTPFSGKRVAREGQPGVSPWIGKARYLLGLSAGRLLGDRLRST